MTTLRGGHSTQFTDRTAEAGVAPANLSGDGGVTRNFAPFCHGHREGHIAVGQTQWGVLSEHPSPGYSRLWESLVRVVATTRGVPGGFEVEDPSPGSSRLQTLTSSPVQALVSFNTKGPT